MADYKQKVYVLLWHEDDAGDTNWGTVSIYSSETRAKERLTELFYMKKAEIADDFSVNTEEVSGEIINNAAWISYNDYYYNYTIEERFIDYRGA